MKNPIIFLLWPQPQPSRPQSLLYNLLQNDRAGSAKGL